MKITRKQLRRIIRETFTMAGMVNRSFPDLGGTDSYSGTSAGGIVLGTTNPSLGTSDISDADEMDEDEEVIDEDEDQSKENE